jgi:hypothetical protein
MLTIRRAEDRGHADHGWLNSHHTFSFAGYHDPAHMGFRNLRVINDDRVAPGRGFGTHAHRDMEIVSYVLSGGLEHKDSMGTGSVLRPGDVQRMTAGTGVSHSEFNASKTEAVHFLQIWILPGQRSLPPGYEEKRFPREEKAGLLRVVASPDGREGSVSLHADAVIRAGVFDAGQAAELTIPEGRQVWVHVAEGRASVNGTPLGEGDGAALVDESKVRIEGLDAAEVLLFELP